MVTAMSAISNDMIRQALRGPSARSEPEWTHGDLYDVIVTRDGTIDTFTELPLSAARRKLQEMVEADWRDAPAFEQIISELRDADPELFVDGRTYALRADESALGEIQRSH